MLDKLQNLDDKYEELGRMLADPEVLGNPEELRKTAKARADLEDVVMAWREYKKASLLSPLFVTLEVIIEVFIPTLMASIIDKGIAANNVRHIITIGILLVVLSLLSLSCGALSGKYAANLVRLPCTCGSKTQQFLHG